MISNNHVILQMHCAQTGSNVFAPKFGSQYDFLIQYSQIYSKNHNHYLVET